MPLVVFSVVVLFGSKGDMSGWSFLRTNVTATRTCSVFGAIDEEDGDSCTKRSLHLGEV